MVIRIIVRRRDLPRLKEKILEKCREAAVIATKDMEHFLQDLIDVGWSPYARSTILQKIKKMQPLYPTLFDSGAMKSSLQVTKKDDGAVLSADSPADLHESGTAKMPARPWMFNNLVEHQSVTEMNVAMKLAELHGVF